MEVLATLTEVRRDGMQKWEDDSKAKSDHLRYIWLNSYQSKAGLNVGQNAKLVFHKGTGGAIGGHWAVWKLKELIND